MKTLAIIAPALALAASAAVAQPAQTPGPAAQPAAPQPTAAFQQRSAQILQLINGAGDPATIFAPAFLQQVPAERIQAMSQQIRGQAGQAVAIEQLQATSATEGTFVVRFERMTANAQMVLEPAAPHLVRGLMLRPAGQ